MIERNEISKEETIKLERKEISRQDVSRRAYELYVQRGSEPGKDIEDWVKAERELSATIVGTSPKAKAPLKSVVTRLIDATRVSMT